MTVHRLPPVEPWPTELFEELSILDIEALIDGAHAEIVKRRSAAADPIVDTCGDCGEAIHRSESICAACGAPHVPKNERQVAQSLEGMSAPPAEEVTVPMECTCGTCARCSLASYEPSVEERLMVSAMTAPDKALARQQSGPRSLTEDDFPRLNDWSVKQ